MNELIQFHHQCHMRVNWLASADSTERWSQLILYLLLLNVISYIPTVDSGKKGKGCCFGPVFGIQTTKVIPIPVPIPVKGKKERKVPSTIVVKVPEKKYQQDEDDYYEDDYGGQGGDDILTKLLETFGLSSLVSPQSGSLVQAPGASAPLTLPGSSTPITINGQVVG